MGRGRRGASRGPVASDVLLHLQQEVTGNDHGRRDRGRQYQFIHDGSLHVSYPSIVARFAGMTILG